MKKISNLCLVHLNDRPPLSWLEVTLLSSFSHGLRKYLMTVTLANALVISVLLAKTQG